MGEAEEGNGKDLVLAVRSGVFVCMIPLDQIVETMRPGPVQVTCHMPQYMDGVAMIRGEAVPVVRLSSLLGADAAAPPTRLVVVKAGQRRIAISVEETIGVLSLERSRLQSIPPLLKDVFPEFVSRIQFLDGDFFMVLQASRVLPAEVWSSLEGPQA